MNQRNDRQRDNKSRDAGQRQRQEGRDATNRPWGRASAVIEQAGQARGDVKARFVYVGTVWQTEQGNLKLVLESAPNQWSDPHVRRVVVLTKIEEREEGAR
jgi:hypothetical protein